MTQNTQINSWKWLMALHMKVWTADLKFSVKWSIQKSIRTSVGLTLLAPTMNCNP